MDALKCAKEICQELEAAGFIAYFAGGWVRDFILGRKSDDIDIATNASPEEISAIFPNHVLVGAQFGVVLVLFKNFQFEIASFRQDLGYTNGRSPTSVQINCHPEEDAKRRDFTINGMFYNPMTEEIYDYVGGKNDLQQKIIRTIGNPYERFEEDRLRMLRAIRFAFRFDFHLDEKTKEAIVSKSHTLLPAVSMERIWQELCKMHSGPHFKEALALLFEVGLLATIFPPLKVCSKDEFTNRLEGLENLSTHVPTILFIAKMFQKETSYLLSLCEHVKTSKEDMKWVDAFIEMQEVDFFTLSDYETAKILANARFPLVFETLLCEKTSQARQKAISWYEERSKRLKFHIDLMKKKELQVKATDLQERGIKPGKEMGELLKIAQEISVNENLVTKDACLEKLQQTTLWKRYVAK